MSKLSLYTPFVLLIAMLGRILYVGASFGDALSLAVLGATWCYVLYLESKKIPPLDEQLKKDLADMRNTLTALKLGKAYGAR